MNTIPAKVTLARHLHTRGMSRGRWCVDFCEHDVVRRVQRQRAKGWRMPAGAVYVGRPTRWGNPYYVAGPEIVQHPASGQDWWVQDARASAVEMLRRDLLWDFTTFADYREDLLRPLRGHDLACWCPLDQPCHADVLLELANGDHHG